MTHSKLSTGRRPFELWRLSRGEPALAYNLAWVLAAISSAALVWRLQIANRAPLVWDEAVRVDAGASLTYAIRSGDFHGAWDWIHTQVFYPFLGPAFNGLTLLVTHDPLAAAWVPSLVAYTLAGMLAGRLALDLGAGPVGALCAGLLTWTAPIIARDSAGAFTEPIGACLLLALLILLVRIERQDSPWIPTFAGLVAAVIFFLKYDYGLLALGTIFISGLAAVVVKSRRTESLERHGLALAVALGLISAWLAVNTGRKIAGATQFVGNQTPGSAGGIDWTYYSAALFTNGEVGLSSLVAIGLSLAILSAVAQVGRREMKPPVICLALWYVMYSIATTKYGRYLGTIMPLIAAFGGLAVGQLIAATHFQSVWLRRVGLAVMSVAFAWQLVAQTTGPMTGVSTSYWFLAPNPAAADAVTFASSHLSVDRGSVLMLGQTNEFSSYALHLAWSQHLDRRAPPVNFLGETGRPVTRQSLMAAINGYGARQVVGVDISPGSTFDTLDYRKTFPSQPQYLALAYQLESSGTLIRQGSLSLEGGRLYIVVWDYRSP